MRRTGIIASSLLSSSLMIGLSACSAPAGTEPAAAPARSGAAAAPDPSEPPLPTGWRWESYGGVQVGVPGDFGWGVNAQRLSQWCVGEKRSTAPVVGRPGASTLVACRGMDATPSGETLLKNTGTVVALQDDRQEGLDRPDGTTTEGDRTTVTLGGVSVGVQAPKGLREQIAGTVHRAAIDANGCPATHPITGDHDLRPGGPVAVSALTGVTEVAVCRYALDRPDAAGPGLLGSLRLSGPSATTALAAITAAPLGGGPDAPSQCSTDTAWGDEVVVLRVRSAAGGSEVFLRYSGCDHNGFDDGVAERALTAAATDVLLAGPHQQYSGSGHGEKTTILHLGRPAR
jgi:hypothetical protein